MCLLTSTLALQTQWFKYSLYLTFPLIFGYGLGRIPFFWERTAEVVSVGVKACASPYPLGLRCESL